RLGAKEPCPPARRKRIRGRRSVRRTQVLQHLAQVARTVHDANDQRRRSQRVVDGQIGKPAHDGEAIGTGNHLLADRSKKRIFTKLDGSTARPSRTAAARSSFAIQRAASATSARARGARRAGWTTV